MLEGLVWVVVFGGLLFLVDLIRRRNPDYVEEKAKDPEKVHDDNVGIITMVLVGVLGIGALIVFS